MIGFIGGCLFILIMQSGAAGRRRSVAMITATGRAVISHGDALNEAKNTLEDAPIWHYQRCQNRGFSSVQADTAPAICGASIFRNLDYNIVDEILMTSIIGPCSGGGVGRTRRLSKSDAWPYQHVCPSCNQTRHVPGWLSTKPQLMVRALMTKCRHSRN